MSNHRFTSADVRALARSAIDSLRAGDAGTARETFERIVASGHADASVWLGIAHACLRMSDEPAALGAIDKALALDPRSLRALVLKGDLLARQGDARAAAAFYRSAVAIAPAADRLPPDLAADIARAKSMCERYAGEFEALLRERLIRSGLTDRPSARRFRQSLDILFGRRHVYYQQPKTFYFPELPQVQFYERDAFPWLDEVERATDGIRAELLAVLHDGSAFTPYVERDPSRPPNEQMGMLGNADWSAFYLWKYGEVVPENAARCPKTFEAMSRVPLPRMNNRSPSVLFSQLRAGARIPPHSGLVNTRLICHLPLIVPEGCGFRVGNETREWVEGKAWVFDDTIEHEAWNRSDRTRVILLFEVWRPELSQEERALVCELFAAIDGVGGRTAAWEI